MRYPSLLLVSALACASAACDRAHERPFERDPTGPGFALRASGNWGTAASIDPLGLRQINTSALEGCPNESPDGRALFFASNRDGQIDIWVSPREGNGAWGPPAKLPEPVNSGANDFCPTALPGGGLLFVSTRADGKNCGVGTADMYQARRDPARGWLEPEHLGCSVNGPGNEFSPSYVAAGGGMLFFSSDRSGTNAIYVSRRGPDGVWGSPEPVHGLNLDGYHSVRPNVSQDGREIVFDSDRPGGQGAFDVWYAHRASPWGPWSTPVNAGATINSASSETRASLSRDGRRLYFGSNRPGFRGNSDIFVADRQADPG